jgi:hypothetical protein
MKASQIFSMVEALNVDPDTNFFTHQKAKTQGLPTRLLDSCNETRLLDVLSDITMTMNLISTFDEKVGLRPSPVVLLQNRVLQK